MNQQIKQNQLFKNFLDHYNPFTGGFHSENKLDPDFLKLWHLIKII